MKLKVILTAALLLSPTAALAAPGIVAVSTGLRAGPGPGFPLVDRIPGGARVNIHGCLRGDAWCDISWSGDRGWISSQYLEYLYRDNYVYLPDYVDVIDVPIVPFVLSSYWSSYYSGRPWYQRRAHWSNYWTSHESAATRMTVDRSAARIGRAATRNAAISEGRTPRAGLAEGAAREQGAARIHGGREVQGRASPALARTAREHGRVAHENGAATRANARMQPMAHARMQPPATRAQPSRVSAAPAARQAMPRVAQPNVGRSPMSAHAQTPMPHAAPAMPRGGGGAPQVNAAPRGGGGPAAGAGRGQERH